jgi:hypothetical protein
MTAPIGGHIARGEGGTLAKTNYSYEKRQRELAKKKKQEEKRQRKAMRADDAQSGTQATDAAAVPAAVPPTEDK